MNAQFKLSRFDQKTLNDFAESLDAEGFLTAITWKKNNKVVEGTHPKVNVFQLETDEKWFVRVIKNKGYVRFKNLTLEQEKIVLKLLKKYHLYSDPNWGLGIGLIVLYFIIEFFISSVQTIDWLMPIIMIMCCLVVLFLWVAYLRAQEKVSKGVYITCMVFGIPSYIFTALGSLLALPLFIAINRYHLTYKIFESGKLSNP